MSVGRAKTIGRMLLMLAIAVLVSRRLEAAVDFSISPASISNTFQGTITVNISGLDPGQGCRLAKFLDVDANGQIDPGEPLVASFGLRDGQVLRIGGVRLWTAPGDEDLTSNGVVRAEFPLAFQGEVENVAASYLYRVSHPTNAFPAVVKPFSVTPSAFGQSFTGTILGDGAPVPGAGVVALQGFDGEFVAGVSADSLGRYALSVPPGTYQLVAFRPGYVCRFSDMPILELGSGVTLSTNLPLTAATHTLSGQLRVAQTTNVLAGFQAFCESDSGEFALAYTDTNGNFSIGVTPGVWEIEAAENVVSAHGLLFPREPVPVDASTGSVAGLVFELPRATALIHGSVKDEQNAPVAGLPVYCDSGTVPFGASGMTDENGEFSVGVVPGDWWLGFNDEALFSARFILQSGNVTLTDGQAQRLDFVARRATAELQGFVRMPDGSPLREQSVVAWSGELFNGRQTSEDGSFRLLAVAGTWSLQLEQNDARAARVIGPRIEGLTLTNGANLGGILLIARPLVARIAGRVTAGGLPLANLWVNAQADFGTNRYEAGISTDPNGHYALDVAEGTWRVGLNCDDLQGRGYSCPSEVTVVIAGPPDQVRDFAVDSIPPLQPHLGSPGLSGGQFQFIVNGQSGRRYLVRSTADLANWSDLGTYSGPSFWVSDPVPAGSRHRFYRVEVVP